MRCYKVEYISQKGWSTTVYNFSSAASAIQYYTDLSSLVYWRKLVIIEGAE